MMMGLPNLLTISRVIAVPALFGAFFLDGDAANWAAFAIFAAAGVTDFFDGYLARRYGAGSRFGAMLDPIADKLIVAAALVMLAGAGTIQGIHLGAVIIILSREILISGLREFLSGDQIEMPVTALAKWKTTIQMFAIGFLLVGPAGDRIIPGIDAFGFGLLWIAAAITLYTGYIYLKAGLAHISRTENRSDREASV
jgi:cardiolipin synthase